MTHEQHAKKFLEDMLLGIRGYSGPKEREQIDRFFNHLKKAVVKECKCTCGCPNRPSV